MITVKDTKANRAVKNAVASMAIEDLHFDEKQIRKMLDLANGKTTIEKAVADIKKKYE